MQLLELGCQGRFGHRNKVAAWLLNTCTGESRTRRVMLCEWCFFCMMGLFTQSWGQSELSVLGQWPSGWRRVAWLENKTLLYGSMNFNIVIDVLEERGHQVQLIQAHCFTQRWNDLTKVNSQIWIRETPYCGHCVTALRLPLIGPKHIGRKVGKTEIVFAKLSMFCDHFYNN